MMHTILIMLTLAGWQEPDSVLTPEMAVAIALEKNYDIRLEKNTLRIAENDNTFGNAGFLPTVQLSGRANRSVQDTEQEFISGDTQSRTGAQSTVYGADATLAWTIFDGLKMFATKDRLEQIEQTNGDAFKGKVQTTVSDVLKAFYNAALEQERLALLQSALGLSEERVRISKDKYEVGKSSKLEFLQAQVDYNTDKSALVKQQEVIASQKFQLFQLLAMDTPGDLKLVYSYDLEALLTLEELESDALTLNPDLRYLMGNREIALLETRERERELMPSLDFNLGYSYNNLSSEAGFLLSNQTNGVNFGFSATMTLFDGWNQQREIQNARVRAESANLFFDQAKTQLLVGVRTAFLTYSNSLELVSLEEENLEVARENVEIALERYRIGKSNSLEIREAQNNAVNAEIRYLEAMNTAKLAEIELMRLSGQLVD